MNRDKSRQKLNRRFEKLEARNLLAADVYISEFVASNDEGLQDEDGDAPDWIEIYNAGPDDVDLVGWHLTDDAEELRKWSFPAVDLSANQFLVVYASNKDRQSADEPLHTNFKLKSEGEYLALTNDFGAGADTIQIVSEFSPTYVEQFTDVSYGVAQVARADSVTSGSRGYFKQPTPGARNAANTDEVFPPIEIELSHAHGFYDEQFSLSLSASVSNTLIRYTLDGSEPTGFNGSIYRNPIRIRETTTIRVFGSKTGRDPSSVQTATYIFLDDVLEQSTNGRAPTGFPSSQSINGQVLDYGMDPTIVDDATWGSQLKDALTQIPSMSIVMDIDDLLGRQEGIYVNASLRGRDWERAASLELIDPNGEEGFQVEAGVRIRGGFSRSDSNPKHAFRFFFREEYGDAKLEFPLFGEEGADEFDKIDLRTTQNYSWSFRGSANNAFVRDVFSRDMQRELGQPYTRSRYYHLYLNGQYWGLYQTQERAEARFAASYLGGDAEDYDVVKSTGNDGGYQNEATDGTMDAYQRLADYFYQSGGLKDRNLDDYYRAQGLNEDGTPNEEYERLLNVDNLIDYMLITYFTGDRDAPVSRFVNGVNNYFAIFNRENPDGFLFFEHDSEHSLDQGFPDLAEQITTNGRQFKHFNPLWMHEQLVDGNSEYQLLFADRLLNYVEPDGPLSESTTQRLIDERAKEIDLAIIAESARWGDAKSATPFTKNDWQDAVDNARGFLAGRGDVLVEQFLNLGWLPDVGPPEYRVDGELRDGGPISIRDDIHLAPELITTFDERLISASASWTFLDDGTDQGTQWREPDFSDDGWRSGRGQFGYGDGDETTNLGFGSDANNKHITSYFRHSFNVQNLSRIDALMLRVLRDDGAVVYLNGEEIARSNMPNGTIDYQTRAIGSVGGDSESTFFRHRVDSSQLREGTNVLAVEVHQVSPTSSDVSFDLELLGGDSKASGAAVYYTLDDSDPRLPGGDIHPEAIRYRSPFSIANSGPIRARSLLGGEWSPESIVNFQVTDPALKAVDDRILVDEGGTVSLFDDESNTVLANDIGLQNAPLRVVVQSRPKNSSSFQLNRDGTFEYVHDGSETTTDAFTYRVTDANGKSDVATAEIVVRPVSDETPNAVEDEIELFEGGTAFLLVTRKRKVTDNDEGFADAPVSITLERPPEHASRFEFNPDGTFSYRHDGTETRLDSFAYRVEDNDGQFDVAEVTITVKPVSDTVPRPVDDRITVNEGDVVTTLLDGNTSVMDNDERLVDTPFVATIVQPPEFASAFEFRPDGTFSYQHDNSDTMFDSFVYRVTDGDDDRRDATVRITVNAINESTPVAVTDEVTVNEGGTATSLASGEDNVIANDEQLLDGPYTVRIITQPQHSSQFRLDAAGTFRYVHNGTEEFSDSFTYELRDVDGDTDIGEVTVTVLPRSDAAPGARNDSIVVAQGGTTTVLQNAASSVLENDRGLTDAPIMVSVVTEPQHASQFVLNVDGTFSYTHDGSETETDSFVYRIEDSDGQTAIATVRISILAAAIEGDLNQDAIVNDQDIDELAKAIDAGEFQDRFDLNGDDVLTDADIVYLVEEILRTKRGDIDLNGAVEFADFLLLADAFGQKDVGWRDGNLNEDGQVDFADFLLYADNFGFRRVD